MHLEEGWEEAKVELEEEDEEDSTSEEEQKVQTKQQQQRSIKKISLHGKPKSTFFTNERLDLFVPSNLSLSCFPTTEYQTQYSPPLIPFPTASKQASLSHQTAPAPTSSSSMSKTKQPKRSIMSSSLTPSQLLDVVERERAGEVSFSSDETYNEEEDDSTSQSYSQDSLSDHSSCQEDGSWVIVDKVTDQEEEEEEEKDVQSLTTTTSTSSSSFELIPPPSSTSSSYSLSLSSQGQTRRGVVDPSSFSSAPIPIDQRPEWNKSTKVKSHHRNPKLCSSNKKGGHHYIKGRSPSKKWRKATKKTKRETKKKTKKDVRRRPISSPPVITSSTNHEIKLDSTSSSSHVFPTFEERLFNPLLFNPRWPEESDFRRGRWATEYSSTYV